MRRTLRCRRCDNRALWRVEPVRERSAYCAEMPVAFDSRSAGIGHFELLVCASCGYAEWYAHDLPAVMHRGLDVRQLVATVRPCVDCSSPDFVQVNMKDTVAGGIPVVMAIVPDPESLGDGVMATVLCRACGRAEWYASPNVPLGDRHWLGATRQLCEICGAAPRNRLRALERAQAPNDTVERAIAIRITAFGWRPLGGFEMQVCQGCGHTAWFGVRLEELSVDPHAGVSEVKAVDPLGGSGPYR
jgi:predicted nucleic-acid-binding Zn-ribbon protein